MKIIKTLFDNLEVFSQDIIPTQAESLKDMDVRDIIENFNYLEGCVVEHSDKKWTLVYHLLFRNTNPAVPVNFDADGQMFYLDPVSAEQIYLNELSSGGKINPDFQAINLINPQHPYDHELQNQISFRHIEITLVDE